MEGFLSDELKVSEGAMAMAGQRLRGARCR